MHAALRGETARSHAEFLQRVRKRQRQAGGVLRIVVDGAVERICHAELEPAGDGNVHAALEVAAVRTSGLDGRAGEHDQIGDLASLKRQLDDALLFDHRADAGAAHVDERRGRLDRHGLLEIADASDALIVGDAPTCSTMPVCT